MNKQQTFVGIMVFYMFLSYILFPVGFYFLVEKTPLPGHISLPDAPFWSPAQASFLREALADNADWAELVDQLNEALRLP